MAKTPAFEPVLAISCWDLDAFTREIGSSETFLGEKLDWSFKRWRHVNCKGLTLYFKKMHNYARLWAILLIKIKDFQKWQSNIGNLKISTLSSISFLRVLWLNLWMCSRVEQLPDRRRSWHRVLDFASLSLFNLSENEIVESDTPVLPVWREVGKTALFPFSGNFLSFCVCIPTIFKWPYDRYIKSWDWKMWRDYMIP